MSDASFMRLALEEARRASDRGEVPVGAVVVFQDQVVGRGGNRNLTDRDPTAHAEIVALRDAARALGNHRLVGCQLFVTIEPCAMCAGAMVHARIQRLVYGSADPKAGAIHSVMQLLEHPALNHRVAVSSGVLGEECAAVIQEFFRRRRAES